MPSASSRLTRPRQPMSSFVRQALTSAGLMADYRARPAYQQNDYLLWINGARRQETKDKRLQQMLDELRIGGVYMKMPHLPSAKAATGS